MRWRQAKKMIKLDGKGKGHKRRWSAYHRIKNYQMDKYLSRQYCCGYTESELDYFYNKTYGFGC